MKSTKILVAFVLAVDAAAVVALMILPASELAESPWAGGLLVALGFLAGLSRVRIPILKTQVTAVDPFVFSALVAVGPQSACLVAVTAVIGTAVAPGKGPRPVQLAFNLGTACLSTALCGWVFAAGGGGAGGPLPTLLVPLVLAVAAFFVVNTALVNVVVSIDRVGKFFSLRVWRESFVWVLPASAAGFMLTVALLTVVYEGFGWTLALALTAWWLLLAYFRAHAPVVASTRS